MTKLSSRDILGILRYFEVANDNNVPRNIENIKTTSPNLTNSLIEFKFLKHMFSILLDESADDDKDYIISQINKSNPSMQGELYLNPRDESKTYAMPFRQKSCYLYEFIIKKNRLDAELAKRNPEISRSTWRKYIESGYVSVNNKVITSPKYDIDESDAIAVNIPPKSDFSSNEMPIIYIDDDVIVINKPNGALTHSKGALNDEFTVAEFFKKYSNYNSDTNRPGIVHRLDRDTSGVIIGARNDHAAEILQKQFADRKTKKTYIAILDGHPKLDEANIDLPIGRNPSVPSTFRVDPKGKNALTHYEVIAKNDKYSLVKLTPKTGRTHQLRVHMKYINTPILGDKVYGKASDRLYLHAYSLEITLPNSERHTFFSPLPKDFFEIFPNIKL